MDVEAKNTQSGLRKEFSWILFGNLYYAATQYLLLLGITRFSAPETLGIFSLALAINAPVSLFFSLGLRAVIISDTKNSYSNSTYMTLRVLSSVLSVLVALAIICVAGYSSEIAIPIFFIAGAKACDSVSDLIYGIFQKQAKNEQIAVSMAIRGTLSCFFAAAILFRIKSLNAMCGAIFLASVMVLAFYDTPRTRGVSAAPKWKLPSGSLKLLILLSLPLAFATVLSSLELNIPRYLIEHRIGLAALGVFSALSYPLMLGNQIVGALASAASPKLAEYFHDFHLTEFKSLIRRLAGAGAVVGFLSALVCCLFGRPILSLLKHTEYTENARAFGILAIAAGFSYITVFFGAGLSAMKCFRAKLFLQCASFAVVTFFAVLASTKLTVIAMSMAILFGSIFALISQWAVFVVKLRSARLSSAREAA
ncbi:MAG: oligosaccharide flippase family protein [Cryobacterium sp.]|nr:oligosaccharide flippase family protein [Oligoflexia bacterium]